MTDGVLVLDAFIPYRLSLTSNLVSDTIASTYRALFDLTIPEWRIITVVAEQDGVTQQEIGARTRMDKVPVSRAARALTARGLLDRMPNVADGRSRRLRLTPDGRSLYAQVAPKALELEQRLFAAFDAAEVAAFVAMLRRIDAVILGGRGTDDPLAPARE